jgi:hypothetical protein
LISVKYSGTGDTGDTILEPKGLVSCFSHFIEGVKEIFGRIGSEFW